MAVLGQHRAADRFPPTDRAFQKLAKDLTGKTYQTEAKVFGALASTLGIDRSRTCCSTTSYREPR